LEEGNHGCQDQPIIVIKKKGGHGGHHGGAWKVAYADFVTAMMSLFIVLWLMGAQHQGQEGLAGYFNDPKGTANLLRAQRWPGTAFAVTTKPDNQMKMLKERLERRSRPRRNSKSFSKQIEITITSEGLRIERSRARTVPSTSWEGQLSESGQVLLALLAAELKTLPNSLLIEAITDATPYSKDNSYSNWDLRQTVPIRARLFAAGRRSARSGLPVPATPIRCCGSRDNPTDPSTGESRPRQDDNDRCHRLG